MGSLGSRGWLVRSGIGTCAGVGAGEGASLSLVTVTFELRGKTKRTLIWDQLFCPHSLFEK